MEVRLCTTTSVDNHHYRTHFSVPLNHVDNALARISDLSVPTQYDVAWPATIFVVARLLEVQVLTARHQQQRPQWTTQCQHCRHRQWRNIPSLMKVASAFRTKMKKSWGVAMGERCAARKPYCSQIIMVWVELESTVQLACGFQIIG